MPSNVLLLPLKQTFPPTIKIFIDCESDVSVMIVKMIWRRPFQLCSLPSLLWTLWMPMILRSSKRWKIRRRSSNSLLRPFVSWRESCRTVNQVIFGVFHGLFWFWSQMTAKLSTPENRVYKQSENSVKFLKFVVKIGTIFKQVFRNYEFSELFKFVYLPTLADR